MTELIQSIFGTADLELIPLPGGDINDVFRVKIGHERYVIKINLKAHFPGMFAAEAKGLDYLSETKSIRIPNVIRFGEEKEYQFLILEYITEGSKKTDFWEDFGRKLATLHLHTNKDFGLDHPNYIGSLRQSNAPAKTWEEFYISQRLEPMVEMAVNSGEVNYVEAKLFDAFYARLNQLYPSEKPALIHGDLWSGNFLIDEEGMVVLIDPAVYYGHREMDIGMMHLFGGFDEKIYAAYTETHPLEKGWENRIAYSQLYPLLVHVNLFGRSYWSRVERILKEFK